MISSKTIYELHVENGRSIEKHGDWADYTPLDIFRAVSGEFHEVTQAVIVENIHGDHGMVMELMQLANTCLKGVEVLRRGDDSHI